MKVSVMAALVAAMLAVSVRAQTVTNQFLTGNTPGTEVLNLSSPGQLLSGTSVQYSTINDGTGAKLITENGDAKDFTLSAVTTTGSLGTARVVLGAASASAPLAAVESGRVGAQHSFTGAVSSNNPGSVNVNTFTLLFNSSLNVTNATFNFSSLNTAGIAWEYSTLEFLDPSGNPFSPITGPGWTIGAAGQYSTAGTGFSGNAGVGNFVAASTGTVTNVGSTIVSSGANGPNDNVSAFNYSLAGLAPGTQIGGIRWRTILEDVRGTGNGSTNFTSSLLDFSITYSTVPEPSAVLFVGAAGCILGYRRRRIPKAS